MYICRRSSHLSQHVAYTYKLYQDVWNAMLYINIKNMHKYNMYRNINTFTNVLNGNMIVVH